MKDQPKLNLPTFDLNLTTDSESTYIFDPIRKKNILLTPEEWVRQHFINLLIKYLHYPKGLMNVESGLTYFKKTKRSDITINHRNKSVFMLIECKAPQIKIDKKTLNQISQYNKEISAQFICVTNGMKHFIWEYDTEKQQYSQLDSFPKYPEN